MYASASITTEKYKTAAAAPVHSAFAAIETLQQTGLLASRLDLPTLAWHTSKVFRQ